MKSYRVRRAIESLTIQEADIEASSEKEAISLADADWNWGIGTIKWDDVTTHTMDDASHTIQDDDWL